MHDNRHALLGVCRPPRFRRAMDRQTSTRLSGRARVGSVAAVVASCVALVLGLAAAGGPALASATRSGPRSNPTTTTSTTSAPARQGTGASSSTTSTTTTQPTHSTTTTTTSAPGPSGPGSGPNLLTGKAATFSGTTGGWEGINSALSWASTPASTANGSLQMTGKATSWVSAWSPFPPSGSAPAAKPAQKFTGDLSVCLTGAPEPMAVGIAFLNASNAEVGAVFGQSVTPAASSWTSLPEVAAVAPASTTSVIVGVVAFASSVGQAFYIESPVLEALGAGLPAVVGPLHTAGNQIIQANGSPVTLQGVVLQGLEDEAYLNDPGVTQDAVVQAKVWGANFVRVPLGEQFWLSSNCDYVSSYQSAVDQVVNWITSMGMVALLDLHTNTVDGCEGGTENNMADEAQSPTFWSEVAQRYGNPASVQYNPLVAFDLYNEPHDVSNSVWLNGGQTTDTYAPYQTYQAAGMQQLYDSVRGANAQNLVFVSGTNWANDPPAQLVNGTNIVYAAHYYTCPNSAPPACSNANPYDPSQDLNLWLPLSQTQPVMVTEFGWPSDHDGTYTGNVIAYARAHGWGWSAFAWQQVHDYGGFTFETFLSNGTAEPEPSGVPVLLGLSSG